MILSCGKAAASVADTLMIVHAKGTQKIVLEERPIASYIQYEGGFGLLVETASKSFSTTYSLDDVKKFYFIQGIAKVEDGTSAGDTQTIKIEISEDTGIHLQEEVIKTTVSFRDNDVFSVRGLLVSPSVRVYSIDGRAVKAELFMVEDGVDVQLESFQRGYYVIKVNNQSYKIYKK